MNDDGLRDLFAPYGEITSSKVMIDHQTGSSLGYGFVRFSTVEETQEAIKCLTGQKIENKTLLCKLSNSSTNVVSPEVSTNLYIKPLLPATTEETLRQMFSEFGTIAGAKVMVDKVTGESRQIGFVRYEAQPSATAALNAMNGHKLAPDQPPLIVKYAESEYQKTARKSRGYTAPYASAGPSSPRSPPSPPSYYYSPPVMFSPIQYMPIPIASPYSQYMAMVSYPHSTSYSPVWRPPYVMAAEQQISY